MIQYPLYGLILPAMICFPPFLVNRLAFSPHISHLTPSRIAGEIAKLQAQVSEEQRHQRHMEHTLAIAVRRYAPRAPSEQEGTSLGESGGDVSWSLH